MTANPDCYQHPGAPNRRSSSRLCRHAVKPIGTSHVLHQPCRHRCRHPAVSEVLEPPKGPVPQATASMSEGTLAGSDTVRSSRPSAGATRPRPTMATRARLQVPAAVTVIYWTTKAPSINGRGPLRPFRAIASRFAKRSRARTPPTPSPDEVDAGRIARRRGPASHAGPRCHPPTSGSCASPSKSC
jgi:hypothetical protein